MGKGASPSAFRLACIGLISVLVSGAALAEAQPPPTTAAPLREAGAHPAVLILNSYHSGYAWSDNEVAAILDTFRQQDSHWLPYVELMDTKRFPKADHLAFLKEVYRQKYRNARIAVLTACDHPALEFALETRALLAPDASIVFCGVNGYSPRMIEGHERITDVAESLDIAGTLEAALTLFPGTKTVVAIHDYTVSGLATRRDLDVAARSFSTRVRFDALPESDMPEVLESVSRLPKDAIVLALSFSRDKAGQVFDHPRVADLLSGRSAVPVFVVHEERLGHGVIGGSVLGGLEHGKRAASLALRILGGVPASTIPVATGPAGRLLFDWQVLLRYRIPRSALPAGSVVVNEPQSVLYRYRVLVSGAIFVVALLGALVLKLLAVVRRKRLAEAALETERSFLQSVIDGLPDPVFVLELDHRVKMRNRSARTLEKALAAEEAAGIHRPFLHAPDAPCPTDPDRCAVREVVDQRKAVRFEQRRLGPGNQPETYEISAAPLLENGAPAGVIVSAHDITQLKLVCEQLVDHERQIALLAHHDPLTGLPNRILFLDRLRQAIARSHRSHSTVALLFLDLDRFKNVNDSLGHGTGDILLTMVAERLLSCVRAEDTVARVGGDEFTVVIEESREDRPGVSVARKIIRALEAPFTVGSHQLYAGASIGIAIFPADGRTVDRLIRNADAAMYLAKERGRGNYQFFTESLNTRAQRHLRLETRLRRAVETDGLEVHYQPIVALKDGKIVAAEALLRWKDDELGDVSPAEFIPVAEETGLIIPIGETVLRKACLAARRWHAAGSSEVRVAVNISARQFWHHDLVASVRSALSGAGLGARFLELELTESLLLPDSDFAVDLLRGLKRLGVRLSLDDFGTGYSSLGYLRRLPLDNLKVAQEFVRDIALDPNDAVIVRAILSLSKTLGFQVIAEGVETQQHVDFFQIFGCDLAQGHYFSPAVPANVFENLLVAGEILYPPVAAIEQSRLEFS